MGQSTNKSYVTLRVLGPPFHLLGIFQHVTGFWNTRAARSLHPGGVQVLTGDAAVTFVSEAIDYAQ